MLRKLKSNHGHSAKQVKAFMELKIRKQFIQQLDRFDPTISKFLQY